MLHSCALPPDLLANLKVTSSLHAVRRILEQLTDEVTGVACVHGAVTAFHADLDVRLNSAPGVRIAQFLSPGFDGCVHEIFATLSHGATLVLRTEQDDPFSHLIDVDVAMMTPSVAAGLDPSEFPNLKFVLHLHQLAKTRYLQQFRCTLQASLCSNRPWTNGLQAGLYSIFMDQRRCVVFLLQPL